MASSAQMEHTASKKIGASGSAVELLQIVTFQVDAEVFALGGVWRNSVNYGQAQST